MARLFAISDLHVGYAANREAVDALPEHPEDWLICAGDVGETQQQLRWTLERLTERFARVMWVPGNHELWTASHCTLGLRGVERYERLVEDARKLGVLTPEDPYPHFEGHRICPLFIGYDYSFAPDGVSDPLAWAREAGIVATDEHLLHADPHAHMRDWCAARVRSTEARLEALPGPKVLIGHWPFRRDLVRLHKIPRYIPWCGTRATANWHLRFDAKVVVTGHLHMRATDWRDGVRFEEVAVGYPSHWRVERGLAAYLRTILPHPPGPAPQGDQGPEWHR